MRRRTPRARAGGRPLWLVGRASRHQKATGRWTSRAGDLVGGLVIIDKLQGRVDSTGGLRSRVGEMDGFLTGLCARLVLLSPSAVSAPTSPLAAGSSRASETASMPADVPVDARSSVVVVVSMHGRRVGDHADARMTRAIRRAAGS